MNLGDVLKEDPETNAVWVLRFTSIQFALALFESLYRPDTNAALAVVGLYGAFSKNKDVIKLYFAFLTLSCLTDLIWMISWGPMLGRDFPERESIERFALAISIMEFILKVLSMPFVFKLFSNIPDVAFGGQSSGYAGEYSGYEEQSDAAVYGTAGYQSSDHL